MTRQPKEEHTVTWVMHTSSSGSSKRQLNTTSKYDSFPLLFKVEPNNGRPDDGSFVGE